MTPADLALLHRLEGTGERAAEGREPAHDWLHVVRVLANARRIGEREGADLFVLLAAAALHELFNFPKGHPESRRSGEVCAERARDVLRAEGVDPARTDAIAYAIAVHPFSLGITPTTLEARCLQDADRLDAIGAIGIARLFASTADMKRPFYERGDPFFRSRAPDDKLWGLDHVGRKLRRIPGLLHTETARAMAGERMAAMEAYLVALESEIAGDGSDPAVRERNDVQGMQEGPRNGGVAGPYGSIP